MNKAIPTAVASSELSQFLQQPLLTDCLSKTPAQLFTLTETLPLKKISSAAGPYLERYFLLEEDGCFAYLHRFVNEDARDEGVHDHPWELAFSQVLHGGYRQQASVSTVCPGEPVILEEHELLAGDSNLIRGQDFHKITAVDNETWTLFVHTQWCRPWGFLHGNPHTGEFTHQQHPSDPNHRWWPQAALAQDSQRQPFTDTQLVA
jgi:hypothetical protein